MEQQTNHIGDTNKMVTMKLYTEEQVIKTHQNGKHGGHNETWYDTDDYLKSLTPIELPSDEVIKNEATTQMEEWFGSGCEEEIFGFIKGAKWMRDKIINK